jgi:hypothetical protein
MYELELISCNDCGTVIAFDNVCDALLIAAFHMHGFNDPDVYWTLWSDCDVIATSPR